MNEEERWNLIKDVIDNKDSLKRHKFRDILGEWLEYAKTGNIPKELDEQLDKAWDEATDEIKEKKKKNGN